MTPGKKNSYKSFKKISIGNKNYNFYSLVEAEKNGLDGINKLPRSLKVLLENLLRYEDDVSVTKYQIDAIKDWLITVYGYVCVITTSPVLARGRITFGWVCW